MKKRLIPAIILIAYSAILIKVMVLKDVPLIRIGSLMLNFGGTATGHANFVPFKTILPYLLGYKGLIIAGINLVGNVALLVPIGFLAPFAYRKMAWKKSLVLAATAGLAIEVMQVVLHVGIFDIDDVILNALGVMIGYWVFVLLTKMVRSMKPKSIAILAIVGIVAVVGAGLYVYQKLPVGFGTSQTGQFNNREGDLCGGTGGTGQIVGMGNDTISMKRNDGVIQAINLTDQTTIRTSAGPASQSDLKTGDRITVVINDSKTASAVLVCNVSSQETQPKQ